MNTNGKYILAKFGEILENDSIVGPFLGTVDGHSAIFIARTNPVGNVYPMITLDVDFNDSNSVIPSTFATVTIMVWLNGPPPEQGMSQGLSKLKPISDRINLLFNRQGRDNACQLNEINAEENIGLRIVRCVKTFEKQLDYDNMHKKYFSMILFDIVMSENEDYTKTYGDKWSSNL